MKKTAIVLAALSFLCTSVWAQTHKESRSEAKSDTKSEAKSDTKSEAKSDSKSESKLETKIDARHDSKNEVKIASLSGTDSEGKAVKLSDYLGKTVLVSFITSGCNLCSRDLKLMREFYANNAKKNFVLLTVNMDQNKNDFDQYNKILALAIPKDQRPPAIWGHAEHYKDEFGAITREPTHFVINPKNQQVMKREGSFLPADWDNLWESLNQ